MVVEDEDEGDEWEGEEFMENRREEGDLEYVSEKEGDKEEEDDREEDVE